MPVEGWILWYIHHDSRAQSRHELTLKNYPDRWLVKNPYSQKTSPLKKHWNRSNADESFWANMINPGWSPSKSPSSWWWIMIHRHHPFQKDERCFLGKSHISGQRNLEFTFPEELGYATPCWDDFLCHKIWRKTNDSRARYGYFSKYVTWFPFWTRSHGDSSSWKQPFLLILFFWGVNHGKIIYPPVIKHGVCRKIDHFCAFPS